MTLAGFLFLVETPMHPHSGTLLHTIRSWGYKTHRHPFNASSQPDGLPEARLPNHITHPGGGCWLAYKKITSWSPMVSLLILTQNCPSATTCAVELNFLNGSKVAIISCYLPQTTEVHAIACDALSQLPNTYPHHLIMGGVYKGAGTPRPRRTPTSMPSHTKGGRGPCSPLSHRATNCFKRHALTI